jgi:hypothetical protein
LPTESISVVRKHFWQEASRGAGGFCNPKKYGLICTMPAVVNSRLVSLWGIKDELGITLCPLCSKKLKKTSLISSLVTLPLPSIPQIEARYQVC